MGLPGWASNDPDFLCGCIRDKYERLLDWAFSRKPFLALTTIETARNITRQKYYVKIGASRTLKSKHLVSDIHSGFSLAFDIAPTEYLSLKAWNPKGPLWQELGKAGEKLGLEWGGRWKSFPDLPHFQLSKCECKG
jgi:hypothetical protein